MSKTRRIELFKAGNHTAGNGAAFNFTPDLVREIAAGFDPAVGAAPAVIGHPDTDAPAYGWAKALTYDEGSQKLYADVDVHDALDAAIEAKHYNRTSAAFFSPDHPSNPKPGKWYLRHVGMLGGAAPAIAGLAPFGFTANSTTVAAKDHGFQFADAGKPGPVATLEQSLAFGAVDEDNDTKGVLAALATLPAKIAAALRGSDASFSLDPAFTAAPGDTSMTPEQKTAYDAAIAENVRLKAEAATFAAATARREATEFCAALVKSTRLLPADVPATIETYVQLSGMPQVEFAVEGVTTKQSPLALFKKSMEGAAATLDTSSKAGPEHKTGKAASSTFAAAEGVGIDSDAEKVDALAMKLVTDSGGKMTYAAAVPLAQAQLAGGAP